MPIAWSRRKRLAPRTAPPPVLVKTGGGEHIAVNADLGTVRFLRWPQAGVIESFVDGTGSHAAARFRKP